MKISAFSYVRNGLQYGYPFLESMQSLLPIVDEFVMVLGDSTDGTRAAIEKINSPKIRIVDTVWDMSLKVGGRIFAQQANIGLDSVSGDWLIHIQADEVFHEKDVPRIKEYIERYDKDEKVDGLLFPFLNFRGDYFHIHTGRKSHRFEIRAFKRNSELRSYRDPQGFRKFPGGDSQQTNGEKLNVIKTDIPVYHYSAVRPPKKMQEKALVFASFYGTEQQVQAEINDKETVDYNIIDKLEPFKGSHPHLMDKIIGDKDWEFIFDPSKQTTSFRHKILNAIEKITGWRIGEYKNYKVVKR